MPEASRNTAASVTVSGDPASAGSAGSASGPAASAITSPVGTSSSSAASAPDNGGDGATHAASSTTTVTSSTAADSDAAAAFAVSLADWPIFPDTIPALVKLSSPELGLKLAVLSNVDRASFAYTRAALERGFAFAGAFTAEEIGSYKLRFFFSFF